MGMGRTSYPIVLNVRSTRTPADRRETGVLAPRRRRGTATRIATGSDETPAGTGERRSVPRASRRGSIRVFGRRNIRFQYCISMRYIWSRTSAVLRSKTVSSRRRATRLPSRSGLCPGRQSSGPTSRPIPPGSARGVPTRPDRGRKCSLDVFRCFRALTNRGTLRGPSCPRAWLRFVDLLPREQARH